MGSEMCIRDSLYVLTEQRTLEDRGTVFREPEVPAVPEKAAEPEEGQKEQSEINSLKSARESRRREEKMPSRPVPACHRSDDKKSPPPVLNCHHPSDKLAPELEELNKTQRNKNCSILPSVSGRGEKPVREGGRKAFSSAGKDVMECYTGSVV